MNIDGVVDILWPDHCVQNTPGAQFHEDLNLQFFKDNNKKLYIIKKGNKEKFESYGVFFNCHTVNEKNNSPVLVNEHTGLHQLLKKFGVSEVFVTGLATDYCIRETAIQSANLGYTTYVIIDACKEIYKNKLPKVTEEFFGANVDIVESWELPLVNIL